MPQQIPLPSNREVSKMISCSREEVIQIIKEIAAEMGKNKDYLTELDSAIGDADHGINMSRGFKSVLEKLPQFEDKCIGTILKTVGMVLVSTVGGASGPLYGTAFMYAGKEVTGKKKIELIDLKKVFQAALDGVIKRGKAQVGDKTIVDTLSPVVDYLKSNLDSKSKEEILKNIEEIANRGMESTKPLVASKGRASFLKERSRGHLDPGAVSCYLMIKAFVSVLGDEV